MKDHTRDYAINAFRFYAKEGGLDAYKRRIYNEALFTQQQRELHGEGVSDPTATAPIRAEEALKALECKVADLAAVEKTLYIMGGLWPGRVRVDAIKTVYFVEPERDIAKGEISERVHTAEIYLHTSERNIWRWLNDACAICAVERNLNVSDKTQSRYNRLCGY